MAEMNEQDEALQIFLAEAEDLLRLAETSLLSLEVNPDSAMDVGELFRSVHTLKSSAAMMGFDSISNYTHLLETLLDRLRSGKLTTTRQLISFLLGCTDFIRLMVERVSRGQPAAGDLEEDAHSEQLRRYLGMEGLGDQPGQAGIPAPETIPARGSGLLYYQIDMGFREDLFFSGRDPLVVLQSLLEVGELVRITPDLAGIPSFEELDPRRLYIAWQVILSSRKSKEEIEDVFLFVSHDNAIRIEDVTARFKEGVDLDLADRRLGDVLVERGTITPEDLGEALGKQKKLGEILVENGKIEPEELHQLVSLQEESRSVYRRTSVRVGVEKIEALVNLAEEMGIGLARMHSLLRDVSGPLRSDCEEGMEYLLKVNREFQDRVGRIRMFPLEGTFRRFQSMVRDLAIQQRKQIRVLIRGIDTELDKEIIEHITDPLKHLVRNCVDHGIELPHERTAVGKLQEGTIEFKAYQREGKIYIEIRDDGRGIDWEVVRRKALAGGWIPKDHEETSEEGLADLLFRPGFSTSTVVTELSGRGVGMDVVKSRIEQLGGSIEVSTRKGDGTSFTLCLPLRFTLMDVLDVRVFGSAYLIPLQAVVGTSRHEDRFARSVGARGRLFPFRGEHVPLMDLPHVLGSEPPAGCPRGEVIVFLDTGRKVFGVPVDEIVGSQQVIIKSLETNYRSVKGIAGAAVMADGSVSLVLDVLGIEEMFFRSEMSSPVFQLGV